MCWVIKLCVGAIGAIGLLAYSLFWASSFLDALMLNDCHRMVDALSYNHSGTIYHLGPIETLRVEPTLASCVATELFSDRLGLPSPGAGSSPVLAAASRGRTVWLAALGRNEALEILAESKKCDLDAAMGEEAGNAEGKTAAHHCAENNQWQCIDILGRHGANLDVTDKWGQTPHHAALYFKYDKVLEALERHGAQWSPPPELPPVGADGTREL